MENQEDKMEITIDISDIVNKCLLKIKSTNDSVSAIYQAINNYTGEISSPPIDNLPIVIESAENNSLSIDDKKSLIKEEALKWLYRKAFEDFIVGLNESLIEAYIIVKNLDLIRRQQDSKLSKNDVYRCIQEIKSKPIKMLFPNLITEIEKSSGELPFKMHILSINKVRTCLVHRNGIIEKADTNDERKTLLRLSLLGFVNYREENGKMIPIKKEDKEKGLKTDKLGFSEEEFILEFPLGSHVRIDPNILNIVTYTCIVFLNELKEIVNSKLESNE